jgi:methylated-DNA-protein-cysteine methyltransferase-like protein
MYSPPDPASYNEIVWLIVRQVPHGRVTTYGQVASMIPPPEDVEPPTYDRLAARWVGVAMSVCPDNVPWQRVINSQGKISPRPGAHRQRQLLEAEGIAFDDRDRVDLDRVGWDGPSSDWLAAHNLLSPRSLKSRKSASNDEPEQMNLF